MSIVALAAAFTGCTCCCFAGHSDAVELAVRSCELSEMTPLQGLSVTNLKVKVGCRRPFGVLHVSDSHLMRIDSRLGEDQLAFALARSRNGREYGEYYLDMAMALARRENIPLVHTGDLVEFASAMNFA